MISILTLILGLSSTNCLAISLHPKPKLYSGGMRFLGTCISVSLSQNRSAEWAYAAEGVAWVTRVVVTMPTDFSAINNNDNNTEMRFIYNENIDIWFYIQISKGFIKSLFSRLQYFLKRHFKIQLSIS